MLEIFDEYSWTKERQLITRDRHGIPWLRNISHFNNSSSVSQLPKHFHSNLLEIHCLVKGTRFTQVQVEDEIISYHVTGNQCLITYPMEIHGSGSDARIVIGFTAYGSKEFALSIAPIVKVNE